MLKNCALIIGLASVPSGNLPTDNDRICFTERRDICAKATNNQDQRKKVTLFYNLFIIIVCRAVVKSLCIFYFYQQPQRVWHDFRINIKQNY